MPMKYSPTWDNFYSISKPRGEIWMRYGDDVTIDGCVVSFVHRQCLCSCDVRRSAQPNVQLCSHLADLTSGKARVLPSGRLVGNEPQLLAVANNLTKRMDVKKWKPSN